MKWSFDFFKKKRLRDYGLQFATLLVFNQQSSFWYRDTCQAWQNMIRNPVKHSFLIIQLKTFDLLLNKSFKKRKRTFLKELSISSKKLICENYSNVYFQIGNSIIQLCYRSNVYPSMPVNETESEQTAPPFLSQQWSSRTTLQLEKSPQLSNDSSISNRTDSSDTSI